MQKKNFTASIGPPTSQMEVIPKPADYVFVRQVLMPPAGVRMSRRRSKQARHLWCHALKVPSACRAKEKEVNALTGRR